MDDWTEVMTNNIAKDSRIADKTVGDQVSPSRSFTTDILNDDKIHQAIWRHRSSLVLTLHNRVQDVQSNRPKDTKSFDASCKAMSKVDVAASESLVQLIMKKRLAKSRDLSSEDRFLPLVIGAHVTSWDWTSPTLKNAKRDITPNINAMFLERAIAKSYRQRLLRNDYIGCLRTILDDILTKASKESMTIDPATGSLVSERTWAWWDGLVVLKESPDVDTVLGKIQESFCTTQVGRQRRKELEKADKEAITKLVTTIANMPCARATNERNSNMSADLMVAVENLIDVSDLYPICIPAGVRPTADSHGHVGIGGCSTRGRRAPALRSVDDDDPLSDLTPLFLDPILKARFAPA